MLFNLTNKKTTKLHRQKRILSFYLIIELLQELLNKMCEL